MNKHYVDKNCAGWLNSRTISDWHLIRCEFMWLINTFFKGCSDSNNSYFKPKFLKQGMDIWMLGLILDVLVYTSILCEKMWQTNNNMSSKVVSKT